MVTRYRDLARPCHYFLGPYGEIKDALGVYHFRCHEPEMKLQARVPMAYQA